MVDWPDMVCNASRQPYQNASFCVLCYTFDVQMKIERHQDFKLETGKIRVVIHDLFSSPDYCDASCMTNCSLWHNTHSINSRVLDYHILDFGSIKIRLTKGYTVTPFCYKWLCSTHVPLVANFFCCYSPLHGRFVFSPPCAKIWSFLGWFRNWGESCVTLYFCVFWRREKVSGF